MNPTEYKMNGLYKFAKACALIPIFVGIVALIVGLFDQNEGGSNLGAIATAFLGLGLLPLGLLSIIGYYWKSELPRQQIKSNTHTRTAALVSIISSRNFYDQNFSPIALYKAYPLAPLLPRSQYGSQATLI